MVISEANHDRAIVRQLRTAASTRGIAVELLGQGWILRLTRGEIIRYVYGYTFDLNSAGSHQLVCDKAGTSEALATAHVPHVPHWVYLHPEMAKFVASHRGNFAEMLARCEQLGWDVVVKENTGTGGRGVQRVRDALGLERTVYQLFERNNAICISKYYDAAIELRFIILRGSVLLCFAKHRPTITGDGKRSVLELLAQSQQTVGLSDTTRQLLNSAEPDTTRLLAKIPRENEVFLLNWRHNLGQGAVAEVLIGPDAEFGHNSNDVILHKAGAIALHAASTLGLGFGSVDVLLTEDGPRVLEVNGGVMMEFLSRGIPGGEHIAAAIYEKALDAMFAP